MKFVVMEKTVSFKFTQGGLEASSEITKIEGESKTLGRTSTSESITSSPYAYYGGRKALIQQSLSTNNLVSPLSPCYLTQCGRERAIVRDWERCFTWHHSVNYLWGTARGSMEHLLIIHRSSNTSSCTSLFIYQTLGLLSLKILLEYFLAKSPLACESQEQSLSTIFQMSNKTQSRGVRIMDTYVFLYISAVITSGKIEFPAKS